MNDSSQEIFKFESTQATNTTLIQKNNPTTSTLISNHENIWDVIIVGAGISGLTAGYILKTRKTDIKILIIEANDRIGGRTQTVEIKCSNDGRKNKWDLGGQWVTDSQTCITKIIKDLNIQSYNQYDKGKKVLEANGKILKYDSSIPNISIFGLIDLQMSLNKINGNSKKLNTLRPFQNAEFSSHLNSINLENFMFSGFTMSSSRSIIESAIRTIFGFEASQLNALYAMLYTRSAGSFEKLALTEKDCAQEKRIKGGAQQISQKLLNFILENQSNKILLNCELKEVKQNSETDLIEIIVTNTKDRSNTKFTAKKLISSIPINLYSKIEFSPRLPFFKTNYFKFCAMGNYGKFIVTYEKPFWRLNGFSGEVVSDGSILFTKDEKSPNLGPVSIVYDGTSAENDAALVGLMGANGITNWIDQDEVIRKNEIIEALVRYFGDEARQYIDYAEKIWNNEKYSGGCPTVASTSCGTMTDFVRATREPFMNIHFCGTETATQWIGYMDGAAESGERAANEVLYKLFPNDSSVKIDFEKTYYYENKESPKLA